MATSGDAFETRRTLFFTLTMLTVDNMSDRGAFWLIHRQFDYCGILIVSVYFQFSNFAQTKSTQYAQYNQPNITYN